MEPELSTDRSTGIASPTVPESQPRNRSKVRWLLRRFVCCACAAFLTVLSTEAVWDVFGSRFQDAQIVIRGGFLLNFDMTLRWSRIWMIGCAIGLLIPDTRLPIWLTRILLGGLCGTLAGVICVDMVDLVMAAQAVEKTYAPFANIELPVGVQRPLPYQKFYPSAFRKVFVRGVIGGMMVGSLFGFALNLSGWRKIAAMGVVSLLMTVFVGDSWSVMATHFEGYVHRKQDDIRHRLQGLRFGEW